MNANDILAHASQRFGTPEQQPDPNAQANPETQPDATAPENQGQAPDATNNQAPPPTNNEFDDNGVFDIGSLTPGGQTQPDPTQQTDQTGTEPSTGFSVDALNDTQRLAVLEAISNGKLKSADALNNLISLADQAQASLDKIRELEERMAKSPFADEFEEKYNQLKLSGANREQLRIFRTINDLGDLSALDERELIAFKLVLEEGWSETGARQKVNQMFGNLEPDYDEEGEEIPGSSQSALQKEEQRVAANKARQFLSGQKAKMYEAPSQEDQRLQAQQAMEKFRAQIKPIVTNIATSMTTNVVDFSLNNKDNASLAKLSVKYPDEFAQQVPGLIESFFETQEQINEETVGYAKEFVEMNYWKQYGPGLIQDALKQGWNEACKALRSRYENPSFQQSGQAPMGHTGQLSESQQAEKDYREGQEEFVRRTRGR